MNFTGKMLTLILEDETMLISFDLVLLLALKQKVTDAKG
jgi:hypothetical protein